MRHFLMLVVLTLLLFHQPAVARADSLLQIWVNGEVLDSQAILTTDKEHVLLPVRSVFEAMDYSVTYDHSTKSVAISRGTGLVSLAHGSSVAKVDGKDVLLDVPVSLVDDRTYVSTRIVEHIPQIHLALGTDVTTGATFIALLGPVDPTWKDAREALRRLCQLGVIRGCW